MPPRVPMLPRNEPAAGGFAELCAGDLEALERLDADRTRLAAERLDGGAAPAACDQMQPRPALAYIAQALAPTARGWDGLSSRVLSEIIRKRARFVPTRWTKTGQKSGSGGLETPRNGTKWDRKPRRNGA